MSGTLYLLPNVLEEGGSLAKVLPASVAEVIATLDGVIVETEKVARRYLTRFRTKKPIQEMPLAVLSEHTVAQEIEQLLLPILKGETWGLLSDAGVPCIADPGAELVLHAHKKGVHVEALVGPCSLVLALMLSGMPAQKFSFQGYLPRQQEERKKAIELLQAQSKKEKMTQACIEAPYRNQELLADLVSTLHESAELAIAWDLTMATEKVIRLPVKEWRKRELPDIKKKPAIFLFCMQ